MKFSVRNVAAGLAALLVLGLSDIVQGADLSRERTSFKELRICRKGERLSVRPRCKRRTISARYLENRLVDACLKVQSARRIIPGPDGAQGEAGESGPMGQEGSPGTALFAVLPPSTILTGHLNAHLADFEPTAVTAYYETAVSFSFHNHQQLALQDLVFVAADAGGGSASCPGSFSTPTAAPGKLCVYMHSAENAEQFRLAPLGTFGFTVRWQVPQSGPTMLRAAWALHSGD